MVAGTKEYIENELLAGKTSYELRLSEKEIDCLKREYPSAEFTRSSGAGEDGKTWFNITIK